MAVGMWSIGLKFAFGASQTLAFVRWPSRNLATCPGFFSLKAITVQGGYGSHIAVSTHRSLGEGGHGTNFVSYPGVAVQSCWRADNKSKYTNL